MKAILKKDIIIKAGSVFYSSPVKTERVGDCHVGIDIGLSKDTSGFLSYCIGDTKQEQDQMKEWFEIQK